MIREKRLKAKIDQVEEILEFEGSMNYYNLRYLYLDENTLAMWDNQIASTCLALNDVIEKIQKYNSDVMVE